MKRSIVSVITVLAVMTLIGCPTGAETLSTPETPLYSNSKNFWGEWVRMDKEETWYISSSAIKINGRSSSKSVSLSKQSDRVIEVSEGGRKYYLYASRVPNTSFTGRIASFDTPQSRALGGLGGIGIAITNLKDAITEVSATTDTDGNFVVEGIIPGDTYQITPEGGMPVTLTPLEKKDGERLISVYQKRYPCG